MPIVSNTVQFKIKQMENIVRKLIKNKDSFKIAIAGTQRLFVLMAGSIYISGQHKTILTYSSRFNICVRSNLKL